MTDLTDEAATFEEIDRHLLVAAQLIQAMIFDGRKLTTPPEFRLLEIASETTLEPSRMIISDVHYLVERDGEIVHQLGRPAPVEDEDEVDL